MEKRFDFQMLGAGGPCEIFMTTDTTKRLATTDDVRTAEAICRGLEAVGFRAGWDRGTKG